MLRSTLIALSLLAALPAAAQDRGGLRMRDPTAVLDQIDANRGCPMSATSVTVGVNKATSFGSSAQQQLATSRWQRTVRLPSTGQHPGGTGANLGAGPWFIRRPDDQRPGSARRTGDDDLFTWL